MVKLAIRDDDVSYFTNSEDIINVYSDLGDFPISYAVVPYMLTNSYEGGNCKELKGNKTPRWLHENKPLINIFSQLLKEKKVEILLHGYTHEYHKVNENILPEFMWRNGDECKNIINQSKDYLEKLFHIEVKWFVAPSNMINTENFRAIIDNKLNYSGLIAASFNRPKTFKSLKNYIYRFTHRLFHNFGYPGLLDYGTHKEIYACPIVEGEYLYKMYKYCKKTGNSMVINTHYWDIRDNIKSRKILFDFIKFAINDGAKPCLISDLL